MEPPTTGQKAIGHDESPVHTWRVSRLERWACPGRWPRSTPTASTGIRSPSWCGAAAPQGSPSGHLWRAPRERRPGPPGAAPAPAAESNRVKNRRPCPQPLRHAHSPTGRQDRDLTPTSHHASLT
jgi:hypothetical protein